MTSREIPQKMGDQLVSNLKLWRYMDFYKFISMLQFNALWFSRLESLKDKYEGTLPFIDHESLKKRDDKNYEWMQKRGMQEATLSTVDVNVDDGKTLAIINCWNMNDDEDLSMWNEYTNGNDGILIRTTLGRLRRAIPCDPKITRIDKVKYVDLNGFVLGDFAASQVFERALLKGNDYSYENELRVLTLNIVSSYCLNDDGTQMSELQKAGPGQFDNKRHGIYVKADLNQLIKSVIISPKAPCYFFNLVKGILETYKLNVLVKKSKYS